MHDIPLFIITSERTFSAAEEFSYNMQTQNRATLVGQTTGGGANPGGSRRINDNLSVFIPTGKAINPITKTNWEGVGVIPEEETSVEDAYDKALDLAQEAAEAYRTERGYAPKVVVTGGCVYGIGTSQTNADLALEFAQDGALVMQLTGAFGGVNMMTDPQREFIENWEVESYRQKQM